MREPTRTMLRSSHEPVAKVVETVEISLRIDVHRGAIDLLNDTQTPTRGFGAVIEEVIIDTVIGIERRGTIRQELLLDTALNVPETRISEGLVVEVFAAGGERTVDACRNVHHGDRPVNDRKMALVSGEEGIVARVLIGKSCRDADGIPFLLEAQSDIPLVILTPRRGCDKTVKLRRVVADIVVPRAVEIAGPTGQGFAASVDLEVVADEDVRG